MKSSHPTDPRAIDRTAHRRRPQRCRENYPAARRTSLSADAKLFAWLFASPGVSLVPAVVRVRAR